MMIDGWTMGFSMIFHDIHIYAPVFAQAKAAEQQSDLILAKEVEMLCVLSALQGWGFLSEFTMLIRCKVVGYQ